MRRLCWWVGGIALVVLLLSCAPPTLQEVEKASALATAKLYEVDGDIKVFCDPPQRSLCSCGGTNCRVTYLEKGATTRSERELLCSGKNPTTCKFLP